MRQRRKTDAAFRHRKRANWGCRRHLVELLVEQRGRCGICHPVRRALSQLPHPAISTKLGHASKRRWRASKQESTSPPRAPTKESRRPADPGSPSSKLTQSFPTRT